MSQKDLKPADPKNQFLDNMVSFGLGDMLGELVEAQEKVLAGVRETAKAGKITLTLKYKRNGKLGTDVDYDIKPTVPKAANKTAPMFQDEENLLHEEDPLNKPIDMEKVIEMNERKSVINN